MLALCVIPISSATAEVYKRGPITIYNHQTWLITTDVLQTVADHHI